MQRCTNCLCDTPDGSPSRCRWCRIRDFEFGVSTPVRFFIDERRPELPIGSDGDGDIDATRGCPQ